MFEITENDILNLSDTDLRALVQKLAIAELSIKGHPVSSVLAGGNQDAADGGLDVRVECSSSIANPDFVPRRITGYQVKKPDMPVSAIKIEMRPGGILRDVIRELGDSSGAYIIVSAQGSVADKPLQARRKAIRDALYDLPNDSDLHTDFYDRGRLVTWANEYPGIVAWVRSRVGRSLSGWSGITDWMGNIGSEASPYLSDDKGCVVDERSRNNEPLTIIDGIERLRSLLSSPQRCIRLVGLSGLGKTRLVQALFEEGIGDHPLDPSLSVYTDYSEVTNPTARDMARDLVARGQRAILIVDNCNPATHSEVASFCSGNGSKVSLITVEYDVRDDEPESTEVFRLKSSSSDLVTEWIKQCFPEISQIDREKIADFSDGNFRVARALAETLGKGETLGSLKSNALFERIFQQRNAPDQLLLRAAEDLSLLYSIEGEDVMTGSELGRLGAIRNIDGGKLYEALVEMRGRGVVQARGRFRAILPHAIANQLAASALKRIPPVSLDQFGAELTPRMLKSISRRIGFLHDSAAAKELVNRWMRVDGPLGDLIQAGEAGIQIVANIAPVAPELVMEKIRLQLESSVGHVTLAPGSSGRQQWIFLIKALGYETTMFDSAVTLLARFLAAEPEEDNYNSVARRAFCELFHIYLSGTKATPEQRRASIQRLAMSNDMELRRSASVGLNALLESSDFMARSHFDFGARSRDWGWSPKINKDVWDWYDDAIDLSVGLSNVLPDVREILASHVRSILRHIPCCNSLERAAIVLSEKEPWIQGWIAFRAALRFEGDKMEKNVRLRIIDIIDRLKPTDLLHKARAVVLNRLNGNWDFADGEADDGDGVKAWHKANEMAQEVGVLLASDDATRAEFLPELLATPHAQRALACGRGLAAGSENLNTMWQELVSSFEFAEINTRDPTLLGGFFAEAHQRADSFASAALELAINNFAIAPIIPYLQARIGVDEDGIERLRRAVAKGILRAADFNQIANGSVSKSPPEPLGALLEDIAALPGGVGVALEILHMYFFCDNGKNLGSNVRIVEVGRELLAGINFADKNSLRDYSVGEMIRFCLGGEEGRSAARKMCENIRSASENVYISSRELHGILKAIFEVQPVIGLDVFLLPEPGLENVMIFGGLVGRRMPVEDVDPEVLRLWADSDPDKRYPALGKCLRMFGEKNEEEGNEFSPLFLSMLERAPDKLLFLGGFWSRLQPGGWSGSLADILIKRKTQVMTLKNHENEQIREWVAEIMPDLDSLIERERSRDRRSEESFE